jgi:hypothetical protein
MDHESLKSNDLSCPTNGLIGERGISIDMKLISRNVA